MRHVPIKNYFFLFAIVLGVVGISFYLSDFYKRQQSSTYISTMNEFLAEVTEEAIDNFVENNPTVVIYISDKLDESLAAIEEEIKELLIEQNLQQYFAYLDISEEGDNNLTRVLGKYDIVLEDEIHLPILLVFIDGKFVDMLHEEFMNMDRLELFLMQTGVIESA